MKKWLRVVLLFIFSSLLVFSSWKIIDIQRSYKVGQQTYAALEQNISFPEAVPSISDKENTPETDVSDVSDDSVNPPMNWPQVDFSSLAQINPNVVGWIFIEGTNINYPIAQATDNNYYLTRLFDGTYNSSGSIFLDASASPDFTDQHSIIFGHHMKNNTMFSALMNYKDPEFYKEHQDILLLTPTQNYVIRIFSGYVADLTINAWEREYQDISFDTWLSDLKKRSVFSSENQPDTDDLIVTLSTCSYEYSDAKYVLHGYIAYAEDVK